MVDCNGAYLHPAYKTHRKLKCTSPFCGRVDNIATGVTNTCSRCSSSMIPIDEIKCPSCGREMYNDNCHWCEEPSAEESDQCESDIDGFPVSGGPCPPEGGDDDYESEEPNVVCWLCEGTGYVMKDRQTGSMHGKHPDIDWSKKDCNEYRCPRCGDGMEVE